jgi:hypothetical protein
MMIISATASILRNKCKVFVLFAILMRGMERAPWLFSAGCRSSFLKPVYATVRLGDRSAGRLPVKAPAHTCAICDNASPTLVKAQQMPDEELSLIYPGDCLKLLS